LIAKAKIDPLDCFESAYNFRPIRHVCWISGNTVHFEILIAAVKSIRTVGSGVRGRSG
jgi:hypothetical protein